MDPSEPGDAADAQRQLIRDLARETLERYRELNLLYRASETIGASLDADAVPGLLLDEARRVIPSDSAEVLLGDEAPSAGWASSAPLIDKVRTTGRPDYTDSALCVPVRAGEKVLGVVVIGRSNGHGSFTAGDEKMLLGLASQAGVALERAAFHEQETRRQRLEEELSIARRIQLSLLPAAPPDLPGWSFAATYQAARQVGGDFYDFLDHAVPDGRLGVVIADVTGKGVPAALMMAYSRAVLRAESMAGRIPTEVLANTNRLIMQERQTRLFLSALYVELELETGRMTYANAGHDAPLLIGAGGHETRELHEHGSILGAFSDLGLPAQGLILGHGETLVLYTDGVTEARNGRDELFGEERLAAAARMGVAAGGGASAVVSAVVEAVDEFTAGAEQADDLTMVVIQREGE